MFVPFSPKIFENRPKESEFAKREKWRTEFLFKNQRKPSNIILFVVTGGAMLETLGRSLQPLMIVLPLTLAVLYLGVARGLLPQQERIG